MKKQAEVSQFLNQSDVFSQAYDAYHELFRHGRHVFGQIRGHGQLWFVKSLANPTCSASQVRLRKEFEITLRLSHPGVIRVVELVDLPGVGPSIIMEQVTGMPLDEFVKQPRISKGKLKQVTSAIIETMAHVHANRVVHHDLKPSNILVCQNGYPIKIIDFGLSDTDSYAILKNAGGTDGYIAPERYSSEYELDTSSDVWAIATIIKRLGLPGVPRTILNRCTSADSNKRLPTAADLYKAIKKSRRRLSISAGIAAVLAAVIIVAIILLQPSKKLNTDTDVTVDTTVAQSPAPSMTAQAESSLPADVTPALPKMPVSTETSPYSSLIAQHDALIAELDSRCALLLDSMVNVFERDSVPTNDRRMRLAEEFTNFMRSANKQMYDFKQSCPQQLIDSQSDEWFTIYARPLDRRHRQFTELMRSL